MNFDINKINMRDTIDYNLYENYEDYTLNELKSLLYILVPLPKNGACVAS